MNNPEQDRGQRSTIRLVEGHEILQRKLDEYKSRLTDPRFQTSGAQVDTIYKIAIAQKLIETGEVDKDTLAIELQEKHGHLDKDFFDNAWGVIADYVSRGGTGNIGGTGLRGDKKLPDIPETPES
jgi:hypothetical protein